MPLALASWALSLLYYLCLRRKGEGVKVRAPVHCVHREAPGKPRMRVVFSKEEMGNLFSVQRLGMGMLTVW